MINSQNIRFTGIMPALVTPFDENFRVKRGTVEQLMDFEYANGVNGFYICGSTGEGPVLPVSTRIEMSETVLGCNNGRGVVIEHVGGPCFADVLELVRHADSAGVDAVSSLAPTAYFRYTDSELIDYYKAIAAETSKPVIVYATPLLVSGNLVALVEKLMEIPNVIGLKYTLFDYYLMSKLKMLNGGDINVINGPDEMLISGLAMGADGGIGSTYNLMPDRYVKLFSLFKNGELEAAREVQYGINRVIDILIRYSENGAIKALKAALNLKGFDTGKAVFPARDYSAGELEALKNELAAEGIQF